VEGIWREIWFDFSCADPHLQMTRQYGCYWTWGDYSEKSNVQ
jgi:hypothetical protein